MLNKGKDVNNVANVATTSTSSTLTTVMSSMSSCNWIIDTGASNHMVHHLDLLTKCTSSCSKIHINVN